MGMLGPTVDLELLSQHLFAQRALGQHAENGLLDHAIGMRRQQSRHRSEALIAYVARMLEVTFLLELLSSQTDFRCIDHYYIVATVEMPRERGLVFPTNKLRDFTRKAA